MSSEIAFQPAEFAIARLSLLGSTTELPQVPHTLDDIDELRAFLTKVASDPVIAEAITVSSGPLAGQLEKIRSGQQVKPKHVRNAATTVIRYLARMTTRPTPFGLLAGVTPARFDTDVKVRIGTEHGKKVRPDMAWLHEVLKPWESDPAVLAHLRVVTNDLHVVRGERVMLPHLSETEAATPGAREHTVRHTKPVRTALAAARRPRRFAETVDLVLAEFPGTDRAVVEGMLATLVAQGFLLTNLRPPVTSDDPLRHVLEVLGAVPEHTGATALAEIADALEAYQAAKIGAGSRRWATVLGKMRQLHQTDRAIQVDLRSEADIVLPTEVAQELAQAATVAWQTLPAGSAPLNPLRDYLAEFSEAYGTGTVVPVKELLDPQRGLGAPGGYLLPSEPGRHAPSPRPDADHNRLLFALAQQATAGRHRELVLDDELVAKLRRPGAETEPVFPIEVSASLLANSEDAIRAGDFRVALSPMNFSRTGAMFGRHLPLVPTLGTALAGTMSWNTDAVPSQLISVVTGPRLNNVVQVPRLTESTIEVGVFAERSRPEVHGLDDLGVTAGHGRLYLVSLRTGEELAPVPFHALNAVNGLPNAARLLSEIGDQRTPPWRLWDWGPAEQLPFLPRVRCGRTALSPARWLVDPELTSTRVTDSAWPAAFDRWRASWGIPDVVQACFADNRIRVDLTSPLQVRMLQDVLRKNPGSLLQEEPFDGEYGNGWAAGHANEIVVPLKPLPSRTRPATAPAAKPAPAVRSGFQPGGEWLSVKVYAGEAVHDELLVRYLPPLLARTAESADRWFFLRYRDDRPHLRIRFHSPAVTGRWPVLSAVHDWAADLAGAGLIRDIVVDTYRPETARYGGSQAIEAAERCFHADSLSVVHQLTQFEAGLPDLPIELLLAANHLDLARRLCGEGWREWLLETYPKNPHHEAFRQHRRQALDLFDPDGGWTGLAALEGGAQLLSTWSQRAPELERYGELVREMSDEQASTAFGGVLHMHHNRLAGIDPLLEQRSYAIARGTVQAQLDRERHANR
jgi:thiopeptide-type bacteriocin biosynthesis protein